MCAELERYESANYRHDRVRTQKLDYLENKYRVFRTLVNNNELQSSHIVCGSRGGG